MFHGAPGAWRAPAAVGVDPVVKPAIIAAFLMNVLVSIAVVRWQIGSIPVRSMLAVAVLGLAFLASPTVIRKVVAHNARLLLLIAGFGALGGALTVLSGEGIAVAARQVIELHVQAALILILSAAVVEICGVRIAATVFIGVVTASVTIALFQFFKVDAAWDLRSALGQINHDPIIERGWYARHERPMGFSYTPVHIATQICLAFAAFYVVRLRDRVAANRRGPDPLVILGAFLMLVAAVITGNRSPILGSLVFLAAYLFFTTRRVFLALVPLAILLLPAALSLHAALADHGLRVASTTDGSAIGRAVLAKVGWHLFLERPVGYGLTYDSTRYWGEYWQYIEYMPNAITARSYPPHNYFLNMLGKYGIGLFLLLPLALPRRREVWAVALPFLAYSVHEMFHNGGPLQADFLIWYIFPMCVPAVDVLSQRSRERVGARWRRPPQAIATANLGERPGPASRSLRVLSRKGPKQPNVAESRWNRWWRIRLEAIRNGDTTGSAAPSLAVKKRSRRIRSKRYWEWRQRRRALAHARTVGFVGPQIEPSPSGPAGSDGNCVSPKIADVPPNARVSRRRRYWEARRRAEALAHAEQLKRAAAELAPGPSFAGLASASTASSVAQIGPGDASGSTRRSKARRRKYWETRRREEARLHAERLAGANYSGASSQTADPVALETTTRNSGELTPADVSDKTAPRFHPVRRERRRRPRSIFSALARAWRD
jgi:hypothetical protein